MNKTQKSAGYLLAMDEMLSATLKIAECSVDVIPVREAERSAQLAHTYLTLLSAHVEYLRPHLSPSALEHNHA